MSKAAVTSDASAASDHSNERETSSRFLPDDSNYRLTGEMPAEDLETAATQRVDLEDHIPEGIREEREQERASGKKGASAATTEIEEQGDDADTGEASAASDSETAAASEAARTQKGKTPATSESRWAKLSRENRELREKNARLEGEKQARGEGSSAATRDTTQGSQPAAAATTSTGTPKPKIDDVDASGKPKYKSYAEYEDAKDQWLSDEAVRKFQETTQRSTREEQARNAEAEIGKALVKKFEGPRAKYEDFDTVALGDHWINPMGSVTDLFLIDSDHAGEVAYYLGQHPEITAGFYQWVDQKAGKFTNKISPQRQFRKLMEIEAQVAGNGAGDGESGEEPTGKRTSARPVTKAPPPPHQVSGKGTVSKDAVTDAIEKGDSDTYMREMNARTLAERTRK